MHRKYPIEQTSMHVLTNTLKDLSQQKGSGMAWPGMLSCRVGLYWCKFLATQRAGMPDLQTSPLYILICTPPAPMDARSCQPIGIQAACLVYNCMDYMTMCTVKNVSDKAIFSLPRSRTSLYKNLLQCSRRTLRH